MSLSREQALNRLRERLIDLSLRNRLLNFQDRGAKVINVVDELPNEVFRLLVNQERKLKLVASPEPDKTKQDPSPCLSGNGPQSSTEAPDTPNSPPVTTTPAPLLEQTAEPDPEFIPLTQGTDETLPASFQFVIESSIGEVRINLENSDQDNADETEADEQDYTYELPEIDAKAAHYFDNALQTSLKKDKFDGRVRRILSDYQNMIESTGSNFLFLAMGLLEWRDPFDIEKPRLAPLILVPINLERTLETIEVDSDRQSSGSRVRVRTYSYHISYGGEPIAHNLTLALKLRRSPFDIKLPEWSEGEGFEDPESYFDAIKDFLTKWDTPGGKPWRVIRQMRIGFFTFGKDVMYRDLDPAIWQDLLNKPAMAIALEGGERDPGGTAIDDDRIEEEYLSGSLPTVLDADGSQLKVLSHALSGRNLVVQGPPGTGKSQTITNIIAACLAQGKRVLFMAEKLAALQVVRSRLQKVGMGVYCLELHSRQAGVAQVHEQIKTRLTHFPPQDDSFAGLLQQIRNYRDPLHRHCASMRERLPELGLSIRSLIGRAELSRLNLLDLLETTGQATNEKLPPAKDNGLPSIDDLNRLDALTEVIEKHWEEAIPEKGAVWQGFEVPRLLQDQVERVRSVLSASQVILNQWLESESDYADIPELSGILPGQLAHIKQDLDFALPASWLQQMGRAFADSLHDEQSYRTYMAFAEQWQMLQGSRSRRFAESEALTVEHLNQCMQAIDALNSGLEREDAKIEDVEAAIAGIDETKRRLIEFDALFAELVAAFPLQVTADTIAKQLRISEFIGQAAGTESDLLQAMEPIHAEVIAPQYLQQARQSDHDLKQRQETLNKLYALGDAPCGEQLTQIRLDLRELSTSWLKWWPLGKLAKSRQAARRFARTGVNVLSADYIEKLEELAKYQADVDLFTQDQNLTHALGRLFKGLETNWGLLERCIQTAKGYRDSFGNLERAAKLIVALPGLAGARQSLDEKIKHAWSKLRGLEAILPPVLQGAETSWQKDSKLDFDARLVNLRSLLTMNLALIGRLQQAKSTAIRELRSDLAQAMALHEEKARVDIFATDPTFLGSHHKADYSTDTSAIALTLEASNKLQQALPPEALRIWILRDETPQRHRRLLEASSRLDAHWGEWKASIAGLGAVGKPQPGSTFDPQGADRPAGDLQANVTTALAAIGFLMRWSDYQYSLDQIRVHGHGAIWNWLERFRSAKVQLKVLTQAAFYQQWLEEGLRRFPRCLEFARVEHETSRQRFAQHDKSLPNCFRNMADRAAWRSPDTLDNGNGKGRVADHTEMSLIRHQLGLKQRFAPVRELVRRAGTSLQHLMPCWMMGPSSVAQFIPPDLIEFDVLLMDEASQIRTEDALGSMARAKQIIIVGDSNQMPPTDFFQGAADNDDEQENIAADELKSVLDVLCKHYPEVTLQWHYRSQHESLIAFSNEQFYDQNLIIPPSVYRVQSGYGIQWNYCPEATYHKGVNEHEAMQIVDHLIKHIIKQSLLPIQESIGIAVMNTRQQAIIHELFDQAVMKNDQLAAALAAFDPEDPIFIKNLENVQGDERDIIVIGFTYGPDLASKRVFQRFGPIARDGGWRRLNVLFTRAKKQVVVFSSMKSGDIQDITHAARRGVAEMKGYLKFAETGILPDYGRVTGRGADSDFELSVAKWIERLGYQPHLQVGVSGFFVDIGVVDPEHPGEFLCGIECDGEAYHMNPFSRERDRLREEILNARGWQLHRIWGMEWLRNREYEIQRMNEYFQRVKAERLVG